ncbi:MAG: elongation factor T [Candidatus Saganbacteria bacterium]|uniref:Elongation factor Ts n=1 Tax=Candidatus Saganbacteria bacterium TaxID=2575572 RepID=A0A833NZT3_UNCSA|nr:MAG: elongation factor T [Candidatus Saganbacteria bacterium]
MADITTDTIVKLREKTGCGMMDCKKALTENNGDMEKAVDFLRKKGLASVSKRAERTAAQGIVQSYIHTGGKIGVLVEVNCETDFVAKNDDFIAFVKDLGMQIAAQAPLCINKSEVSEEMLSKEKEIISSQAKTEGKPEKALEKIIEGRIEKYYEFVCLMEQPFIKDPKIKIKDLLGAIAAKIGENIVVRRFTRYQLGEKS